ncbi:MAG: T9SS type A sorting domain-containing protein [Bacteroidales bacterium]|nr:T9SS type A sorting domain-containing protein [Bacteroidales bacterium]
MKATQYSSAKIHRALLLSVLLVSCIFVGIANGLQAQNTQIVVNYGESNRYLFYDKIPCETTLGCFPYGVFWKYRYDNYKLKVYGVAVALSANRFSPYNPLIPYGQWNFDLYQHTTDSTIHLVDRKIVVFDTNTPYTPDNSSLLVYTTPTGDTFQFNVLEVFFDTPHDFSGEDFYVRYGVNTNYVDFQYFGSYFFYPTILVNGSWDPWENGDSCFVDGCRRIGMWEYSDSIVTLSPEDSIPSIVHGYEFNRVSEVPAIWPIMVPDTRMVPDDTVPPCPVMYPFNIVYQGHDTVVLDWIHLGDGDFQASLDHPGGLNFEAGTLIDFTDSLSTLVLTGLAKGDHTICFRRHCYHECDYHGEMDYYSNWCNCLFFYSDGPEEGGGETGIVVAENSGVRLQPNPAHKEVSIVADEPLIAIELCDMAGRTVLQASPTETNAHTLKLEDIPRGTYMVRVQTARGTTVRKLVVQ